jgi:uncharacterized protein YhbP (UPF0306 family)
MQRLQVSKPDKTQLPRHGPALVLMLNQICSLHLNMDTTAHIRQFMSRQTVASVCCSDAEGQLHCFSCYYAFDEENMLLCFKTSESSLHMQILKQRPLVAGTILPDKLNKLKVQGIQFNGEMLDAEHPMAAQASKRYHLKYPFALAMPGKVCTIALHRVKMTDNSIGFGTRLLWEQEAEVVHA